MRIGKALLVVALWSLLLGTAAHLLAVSGHSDDTRIAVILSHGIQPYHEVLKGFQGSLRESGIAMPYEVYSLEGDRNKTDEVMRTIRQGKNRLLLALGSLATQTACKGASDIPIIAGMILNAEDLKGATNATGVVLEFPLEVQFQWLRRLLPEGKDIGVLYNPMENGKKMESAARLAEQMGLKLHAEKILSPKDLPGALENLAKRANVLWGVADKTVLTPQTSEHLLLFSYRNRIPFIGLSASWVKAGALYSLDGDYADMGKQCAEIALKVLAGAELSSIPPVPPRKVLYSLNLKTAQDMKIQIPKEIVGGAREVY